MGKERRKDSQGNHPSPASTHPPSYPPPKGEGRSFLLTSSSSLQVGFKSATTTLARPLMYHSCTAHIGAPGEQKKGIVMNGNVLKCIEKDRDQGSGEDGEGKEPGTPKTPGPFT